MLGNPVTEDIAALIAAMKNGPEEEQWTMEREECVAQLVQHCKQLLLTDEEECLCGWALVDPFYRYSGGLFILRRHYKVQQGLQSRVSLETNPLIRLLLR